MNIITWMNIQDLKEKGKQKFQNLRERLPQGETAARYYTTAIIILVGLSSFGLGRLSAINEQREPIIIEEREESTTVAPVTREDVSRLSTQSASAVSSVKGQMSTPPERADSSVRAGVKSSDSPPLAAGGKLMGSRNGTKYYFPWCGSNIAEKNKIWFNSEDEAKAKGYSPAENCKGLK